MPEHLHGNLHRNLPEYMNNILIRNCDINGLLNDLNYNKRSVLRRQSRDTNQNIKRSVYCQYG